MSGIPFYIGPHFLNEGLDQTKSYNHQSVDIKAIDHLQGNITHQKL